MSQDLDIHVVEIDGSEDGPGIHVSARPSWVPPPNPGADSINARDWYSTSSLWSTPVAALAARGFVRREAGDLLVYDAPTPETLLSPWFQSGHCFRTEKAPRNNPGWIGIAFRPVADTESKTDVAGTLWVDRATGQLRRLDFTYEHQQFLPSTGCVVNRPPRPYCFRPLSYQFAGTGGWLEFASLPGGEWLVSTWVIRMPGLEFNDRYSGIKSRYVQGRFEKCFQGSNCETNYAIVPRLRTRSGAVATIHRRGQEIYRSDSVLAGLSRIATKQARTGGAHLGGTVTDAAGQPVEGSVVTIESPRRATITNQRGAFEFWNLPAASAVRVHIRRDGFLEETLDAFPVGDSSNDVHIQLRKAPRLPDTHPLDQRLVSRADMPAHTEQRTPSVG